MEVKRLFGAFLRRWKLVAIFCMIGAIASIYYAFFLKQPVYEADTTLYIVNSDKSLINGQSLDVQNANQYAIAGRQLVQNYSAIIYSRIVISNALQDLKDYDLTEKTLKKMISVDLESESNIIVLKSTGTDAIKSAAVANAMSNAFVNKMREITNSNNIGILDKAIAPESPMPRRLSVILAIGILSCLLLSSAIIYISELFDSTIRSAQDIEEGLGIKIIGIIPEYDIN